MTLFRKAIPRAREWLSQVLGMTFPNKVIPTSKLVWLNISKSYLILIIFSAYTQYTHSTSIAVASFFQVFGSKTCWLLSIKSKHLLVTYFHPKISRIAAEFSLSFKPLSRIGLSRTSCTIFHRFLTILTEFVIVLCSCDSKSLVLISLWWIGFIDFKTLVLGFRILGFLEHNWGFLDNLEIKALFGV